MEISDWITAICTLVLCVLTFVYVRLTYRISETQTQPCVVLSVTHDNDRPTILVLSIENIGTSIAFNIRFDIDHGIPGLALGREKLEQPIKQLTAGPLITGIPALEPKGKRLLDWGQYGGLNEVLEGVTPLAIVTYENAQGTTYSLECPLDIQSFKETAANPSVKRKLLTEMEALNRTMKQIDLSLNKIQSNTKPTDKTDAS